MKNTDTMERKEAIRILHSRSHTTIFPRLGVFLAGPTPPSGEMDKGWRHIVTERLQNDTRLDPSMTLVSPEPVTGNWNDINNDNPETTLDEVLDKQIPWELQYLQLCDITAFWLPTYWNKESAGNFDPNIGPTSRWEFGYFLQEYLKNSSQRKFIIGSPEDAESLSWAKYLTDMNNIEWHYLKTENKTDVVADSFIEEIATTLINNKWNYQL